MRLLFVTCAPEEADTLAETLVAEGLVACVNAIPGVRSTYRWEGEVTRDEETVLLMETARDRTDAAVDRIRALHSYDVPKIVVLDPERVDPAYLAWVQESTSRRGTD